MNRDLEALKKLGQLALYESYDALQVNEIEEFDIVQQALITAQEMKKALKLIFEKGVDVGYLKTCKTLEEYNSNCWNDEEDFNKKLTEEEFDLLKRWSNEITIVLS